MDEDREARGPRRLWTARSLDFIQSRWGDTGCLNKENHGALGCLQIAVLRHSRWEAKLGKWRQGFFSGEGECRESLSQ